MAARINLAPPKCLSLVHTPGVEIKKKSQNISERLAILEQEDTGAFVAVRSILLCVVHGSTG